MELLSVTYQPDKVIKKKDRKESPPPPSHTKVTQNTHTHTHNTQTTQHHTTQRVKDEIFVRETSLTFDCRSKRWHIPSAVKHITTFCVIRKKKLLAHIAYQEFIYRGDRGGSFPPGHLIPPLPPQENLPQKRFFVAQHIQYASSGIEVANLTLKRN